MKTRKQNRNNKRTEIERFDWFVERIQTRVAFGWLSERSAEKNFMPEELSRYRFDVILQHDWQIEQCLLRIRVFFSGKTKSPCFDLFIDRLIKQKTNTYRNHFSRSYENHSTRRSPKDKLSCPLRLKLALLKEKLNNEIKLDKYYKFDELAILLIRNKSPQIHL